jgi:hypothetical protein
MTADQPGESGKQTARERRETRLAAALRLNLKRRKTAAKGGPRPADSPEADPVVPEPNRPAAGER